MRLTEEQILKWAVAHRARTGNRPTARSGKVHGPRDLDWSEIDGCLEYGGFGLPGGSSLPKLLKKPGGAGIRPTPPRLTIKQILAWADCYHDEHGDWPHGRTGVIPGTDGESWQKVGAALRNGVRGLPPGLSIAKLLAKHRNVRNARGLPKLAIKKILAWADEHRERTGTWPMLTSGAVHGQKHEDWGAIHSVLTVAGRGLRERTTLTKLLRKHRNVFQGRDITRLSVARILEWADADFKQTGEWPSLKSGPVKAAPPEVWSTVDAALRTGQRGLPGGTSLGLLLRAHRNITNRGLAPRLTIKQILEWADAHHKKTGAWPSAHSGPVLNAQGNTWQGVNISLTNGHRGLPGNSSVTKLLIKHRQIDREDDLTVNQILVYADAHFEHTGSWPSTEHGLIRGTVNETWSRINSALRDGRRGLADGGTLASLLREHRNVERIDTREPFTIEQILAWADMHKKRTGKWPGRLVGKVVGGGGEAWWTIDDALRHGQRDLPGGTSLARLFQEHRGHRNLGDRPKLTIKQILTWADEHHARTGEWPIARTDPIPGSDGDNWLSIQGALAKGIRGLRGTITLAALLATQRGVPNMKRPTRITNKQILAWADDHNKRTGEWPTRKSGPIRGVTDPRNWGAVATALDKGIRGLSGTSSLPQLLEKHRGVQNSKNLPALSIPEILTWAKKHHERTGEWPRIDSGPIHGVRGMTWKTVNQSLNQGLRGLRGGSSLALLLRDRLGVRHLHYPPPLTNKQILEWVDAYYKLNKEWPHAKSGPIDGVPGETWRTVDSALREGRRGLGGQYTLATLMNNFRR